MNALELVFLPRHPLRRCFRSRGVSFDGVMYLVEITDHRWWKREIVFCHCFAKHPWRLNPRIWHRVKSKLALKLLVQVHAWHRIGCVVTHTLMLCQGILGGGGKTFVSTIGLGWPINIRLFGGKLVQWWVKPDKLPVKKCEKDSFRIVKIKKLCGYLYNFPIWLKIDAQINNIFNSWCDAGFKINVVKVCSRTYKVNCKVLYCLPDLSPFNVLSGWAHILCCCSWIWGCNKLLSRFGFSDFVLDSAFLLVSLGSMVDVGCIDCVRTRGSPRLFKKLMH